MSCCLRSNQSQVHENSDIALRQGVVTPKAFHRLGSRRSFENVEFARPERVDWFHNRPLLEPIGNFPSADAELRYCALLEEADTAA